MKEHFKYDIMKNTKTYFPTVFFISIILTCVSCSKQETRLKDVFKDKFYIGTALNNDQIFKIDENAFNIIMKHFNSITAENAMKWERIYPEPGRYYFDTADQFVKLGEENGMYIIGHPLIWHAQTPDWVFEDETGNLVNREVLLERMRNHIFTLMTRYKGRVHGWDVVNEAINEEGRLKQSKWLEIIGEDYIQKAFEYAMEADPDAELYYNDYNIEKSSKRDSVLINLIKELKAKGIQIDGVGIQAHWHLDEPLLEEIENCILDFAELGVKVMFTEMDINVLPRPEDLNNADVSTNYEMQENFNPYPDGLPDSMQVVLAERYADIFKIFVKHSDKVSRVTLWGVHDNQSWLNDWPIKGRTNYPLLFDRDYQPKKAVNAIIHSVNN